MHNEEWSGARISAALAKLEDEDYPKSRLARLGGVSHSTINRWANGKKRPNYDGVRRLAVAVSRQHPDVARELVEASGYVWAEPSEESLPPPPQLSEATKAAMRRDLGDEMAAALIAHHEHLVSGRTPSAAEDDCPPESGGTGRRTAG